MPLEELVDADKCTFRTSNRPLVLEFKLSRAGSGGRVLVNFFEAIFALALSDVFTGRQDTITKYSTSRREMELLSSGSGSSSAGELLLLKMSTLIPGSVFFFPGEEAVVGLAVVAAGAGSASPSFTGETIFPSRELLRFAVRGDAGDEEALTDEPREALPTLVKSGLMFSLSAVALFFLAVAVDDDKPADIADDVDLMFMDSCCIDKLTSDVPLRSELLLFTPDPTEDLTPCNVRADLRAHSNSSR